MGYRLERSLQLRGQRPWPPRIWFFQTDHGAKFAMRIRKITKNCEAKSHRFASHKMGLTSLRFRFAIFWLHLLSFRFRNSNRLRIRLAKFMKIAFFQDLFSVFFGAKLRCSVFVDPLFSSETIYMLKKKVSLCFSPWISDDLDFRNF